MKKTYFNSTSISYIAMFVALLSVLGGVSIPIGPISITLGTLGVYLVGALLDTKYSIVTILIYILMGALGLPVFSNFTGGVAKLVGPTGGYIFGYIFCVAIQGLMTSKRKDKKRVYPVSMLLGTVFIYLFGTIWFLVVANGKYTLGQVMMICVVPFLLGDAIKIIVSSMIGIRFRKSLDDYFVK